MNPTPQQVRWTGLFVLTGIVLFAGSVFWLLGSHFAKKQLPLVCEIRGESVAGLTVGGDVSLRGITIGKVTELGFDSLDPEIVRVSIEIEPESPVYRDAEGRLEIFGITGLKYLELTPGTPAAGHVQAGDILKTKPSLTTALMNVADSLAHASLRVLENLQTLTSPQRQQVIDSILVDLRSTSKDFSGLAADLRATRIDERVARISNTVEHTLQGVDSSLRAMKPAESLLRIDTAATNMGKLAERADLMLSRSQGDIYRSLEDLRASMRDLSQFSATLRDNPAALLRSPSRNE